MTVHITFEPPSRPDRPDSPTVHERTLTGVPQAIAKEMVQDLQTYKESPSGSNPWKLYRYQKIGEETPEAVVLPIDFGEVIDVAIEEGPLAQESSLAQKVPACR